MSRNYQQISEMIRVDPSFKNGDAVVAGSGVRVRRIAGWWLGGDSAESIQRNHYPHLSLAQIYAALTFYHHNRSLIDAELQAEVALELELAIHSQSAAYA